MPLTKIKSLGITDGTILGTDVNSTFDLTGKTVTLPAGVGGKVLQVITATDETSRQTTSTSYVTASNTLAVTITPSSTSSKIFITMSATILSPSDTNAGELTIYRGATNLATNKFIRTFVSGTYLAYGGNISVLDSPSTTSATTYQVYMRVSSGANRLGINEDGSKGTITAFEIAG